MKKIISFIFASLLALSLYAAQMNPRVRNIPQDLQENIFKKPKENIEALVQTLTNGLNDSSAKVKVLHDWICDNIAYDTDLYFNGGNARQDYTNVLKRKKAVCSGYTALMNEMCRIAGIESIGIHGYSKGFGYKGMIGSKTDHEWNAIKIGQKWKLVDVTWDAGYVEYKTWIKKYSTEWLFLAPEHFIFSHLPAKEEFQYLSRPVTKEQFVEQPYIQGKFFEAGFDLKENSPKALNEVFGEKLFDFSGGNGYSLMAQLCNPGTNKYVNNSVWIRRSASGFDVIADVPDQNEYQVIIFAKKTSESNFGNKFATNKIEQEIFPKARELLAQKKITNKEFELFTEAFYKVEENKCYYIAEDLFADARNAAITKIFKLEEVNDNSHETYLKFNVKAAAAYSGYGNILRFPSCYMDYTASTGTQVLEPITGVLTDNSKVKFQVESKEFSKIAVKIADNLVNLERNPKTGLFEGELEIKDSKQVTIFGSKGSGSFKGLCFYEVK